MSQTHDQQPEPCQPQGISLDELTEAFAQVMSTEAGAKAERGEQAEETGQPETIELPADQTIDRSAGQQSEPAEDDPCEISPRTILEAMLFVGNRDQRPLAAARAAELMRGVEPQEIAGLVGQLNQRYAANGCPYHVVYESGGYRLTLRKAFHPLRNRFYSRIRQARLSQAAVDVLAIVAHRQPLVSEQISQLRGKPSSHLLAQLVRRGLLRIERRQTERRRKTLYFTTDRFLKLFGLESLDDLPHSEELDRR